MEFRSTTEVDEALDWLAELGADARILAGGTDVMMQRMAGDLPRTESLVHVGRLGSLRAIDVVDGRVRIGALVTHHDLTVAPMVAGSLPALAQAASTVGGSQTQEMGTIGGNLCNASPAADLAPPVLMAGGVVSLCSRDGGMRTVAADEFFLGRRRTARRPDELAVAIDVEPLPPSAGEVYLKVGRRGAMEVALVGLASRLSFSDGVVTAARMALCSVASRPIRVAAAENALIGRPADDASIAEAGWLAVDSVSPIDDQRATASYRRMLIPRLVSRAVTMCRARAGAAA